MCPLPPSPSTPAGLADGLTRKDRVTPELRRRRFAPTYGSPAPSLRGIRLYRAREGSERLHSKVAVVAPGSGPKRSCKESCRHVSGGVVFVLVTRGQVGPDAKDRQQHPGGRRVADLTPVAPANGVDHQPADQLIDQAHDSASFRIRCASRLCIVNSSMNPGL